MTFSPQCSSGVVTLLTAVALTLIPRAAPLQGQQATPTVTVTGVVGDAQSGAPLADAVVAIPELGMRTLTDDKGNFTLEGVPAGEHRWLFRMLGYSDWEEDLEIREAEHLRVGMLPQPIALQNINVTVDRLGERRRTTTHSVYALEWPEIRSAVAASAADVIRSRSPSRQLGCPAGSAATARPAGANHPARTSPTRARAPLGGADANVGYCISWRGKVISPAIYLNDELTPVPMDVVESFAPHDIHTIEFYDFGQRVLVYTVDFVKSGRPLVPLAAIFRGR